MSCRTGRNGCVPPCHPSCLELCTYVLYVEYLPPHASVSVSVSVCVSVSLLSLSLSQSVSLFLPLPSSTSTHEHGRLCCSFVRLFIFLLFHLAVSA